MRRDLLLLAEMIDAAEQARVLVGDLTVEQLQEEPGTAAKPRCPWILVGRLRYSACDRG